jgi:4-hydroxybenzoate polyprenyltransferase
MEGLPPSARLIGIGFYIGICIVAGTLGGRELDRALDTDKVFTVVGLSLGLVLALWGAMRQLLDVIEDINRRRRAGKRD